MNKVIMDKMNKYNNDYKELLETLNAQIETDNLKYILDEAFVFWNMHKNLIQLFLKNISNNYDTYLFTGATFLDCDDYEHFPFVVLGKVHIIDDPVSKYIKIINSNMSSKFKKKMKEQIILAIQDNLKVLELEKSNIFVLPVTFFNLFDESQKLIRNLANEFMINLFKEKITKEELIKKNYSLDIFQDQIKDEVKNILIFSDYNDFNLELKERYNRYCQQNILPFNKETNDIEKFYFIVYGFFMQALEIVATCMEYEIVPYLRYDISFHYFSIVAKNFEKKYGMDSILLRSSCANMIYKLFEKDQIKGMNFKEFQDKVNEIEINDKLFLFVEKEKIDLANLDSINKLSEYIKKLFEILYNKKCEK